MNKTAFQELEKIIERDYKNIAGMQISYDGAVIYEKYWNECNAGRRIHIYSVTKSIVSALIGIAIDKGYIRDVQQKVLEFFPEYMPKRGEKTIQNITLENLLTMTAPYKYRFFAPYIKYFTSGDWVEFSLDLLGGKGNIGEFRYVPLVGLDILTGILTQATKMSVSEFAAEHLFAPLKIDTLPNIFFHSKEEQMAWNKEKYVDGWVVDPMGVNTAGWGLALSVCEMLKIGLLYLNHGAWENKQIVSAEWITESTKEHSRWEARKLSYGYLWWLGNDGGYAAMGDGGNIIYVNPNRKLVVAVASNFLPRPKDRIELIKKHIEPIMEIKR